MTTTFIEREEAERLLPDRRFERRRLVYRDVSAVRNQVSLIGAVLEPHIITTHTVFCLRNAVDEPRLHFLAAVFNSYVLNWFVRLFMGNHLNTTLVESLPVPLWRDTAPERRLAQLSAALARGERTPATRAAVQAGVAALYGLDAETYSRIVNSFPLVSRTERDAAVRALRRCLARRDSTRDRDLALRDREGAARLS